MLSLTHITHSDSPRPSSTHLSTDCPAAPVAWHQAEQPPPPPPTAQGGPLFWLHSHSDSKSPPRSGPAGTVQLLPWKVAYPSLPCSLDPSGVACSVLVLGEPPLTALPLATLARGRARVRRHQLGTGTLIQEGENAAPVPTPRLLWERADANLQGRYHVRPLSSLSVF